jgi:CheY-like chemotaxis protein
VIDNGEGILEENLKKMFEKGFTTKVNGTGQGLSFVKAQIESWNGEVSINSEVGAGTVVTFSLPLAEKPKLIILDDDKYLLERYKKMLERFGNEAEIYSTGKSLLDNAKNIRPDSIFLLDYDLGDNEVGTDVAQKLSKMGLKNLYLHTGNPMTDDMDYPFLKGILTKGNFAETMKTLSLS